MKKVMKNVIVAMAVLVMAVTSVFAGNETTVYAATSTKKFQLPVTLFLQEERVPMNFVMEERVPMNFVMEDILIRDILMGQRINVPFCKFNLMDIAK